MATIKPVVLKDNKRSDGTYNVAFRLSHKRLSRYIKTTHYIPESQIDKSGDIKMDFIIDYLSSDIKKYRGKIDKLGSIVDKMDIEELKSSIFVDIDSIDFLEFTRSFIEELNDINAAAMTIKNYKNVLSNLIVITKGRLEVSDINALFIKKFVAHLMKKKCTNNTIRLYTFTFGRLFKELKKKYNNEDVGVIRIPQNPFSNIELPIKRNPPRRSLELDDIRKIRDYRGKYDIGRVVFMLTFYLAGINFVDIYDNLDKFIKNGRRAEYERRKTRTKRQDSAYISVSIPEIAFPHLVYLKKYLKDHPDKDKIWIHQRVNRYCQGIAKVVGIGANITTYYARHSFSTIAHTCRIRKDDIAMALNHVEADTRVTDIYIEPDWSIIDEVQNAVINKLNEDMK